VGSGKTHLSQVIQQQLKSCYSIYKGDEQHFLQLIAQDLGLTNSQPNAPNLLTVQQLKDFIAQNLQNTVLIVDEVHNCTLSLQAWLTDLSQNGSTILLLSNHQLDEFFHIPTLVLPPLSKLQIREIIWQEVVNNQISLTNSQIAKLVNRSQGNPGLTKRLVKEIKLGFTSLNIPQKPDDWDVYLLIWLSVGLIAIVRFWGITANALHPLLIGGALAISLLTSLLLSKRLFAK
jgi:hypothetical protein